MAQEWNRDDNFWTKKIHDLAELISKGRFKLLAPNDDYPEAWYKVSKDPIKKPFYSDIINLKNNEEIFDEKHIKQHD